MKLVYNKKDVSKVMGKINHEIWQYRTKYKEMPQMLIISNELELLLSYHLNLMDINKMIIVNNNELRVHTIFGINCLTSPALNDLEFEVR